MTQELKKRVSMEHLNKLYIPPAYTNVKISSNPDSKVLAIGIDSRGRKQYIYNKAFTEEQSILKFSDLKIFGKKIEELEMTFGILQCVTIVVEINHLTCYCLKIFK